MDQSCGARTWSRSQLALDALQEFVEEATCKTLGAQRLKQSGMRWSERGGQAILNLRGWAQSGRFDAAWAELAATYQMEVTVVASVVRIR